MCQIGCVVLSSSIFSLKIYFNSNAAFDKMSIECLDKLFDSLRNLLPDHEEYKTMNKSNSRSSSRFASSQL